jgi:serine/threonine protein kinase
MTNPPADPVDHLAAGTLLDDRYEIVRPLGTGGMGTVYLARHRQMDRLSAVKVLHPSQAGDREALDRFAREARNASRINHPNVCAVYDFGTTPGGGGYLAMEFVEGRTLGSILREQGALPPRRVANLVRETAAGLDAAHRLGIVHRDLKPDNVMVLTAHGRETVKLVDFGIAKALAGDLQREVTAPGVVVGTPDYMAPEQFAGDPSDQRCDLYSLAVIAFRMLTGTLPFEGATAREILTARLITRPRSLREAAPDRPLPAELQRVMDRALARRPEDRFASAVEFAAALDAALSALPPDAADATPTVRLDSATGPMESIPPTIRVRTLTRAARAGLAIVVLAGAALVVRQIMTSPDPPTPADQSAAGNATVPPSVGDSAAQSPAISAGPEAVKRDRPPAAPEPIPPLPDPDAVLSLETRDASRATAEQIYLRTDAPPVLRAQAAFIVAQVFGEQERYADAGTWARRAAAANDSAPAGEERNQRAGRYRSFLSQLQLKTKDSTTP